MPEQAEPIHIARNAAQTALPFAEGLAGRYASIASGLRRGEDADALTALGNSTDDMEHFLSFLVLIGDYVKTGDPTASVQVQQYQDRLMEILEGMQPALAHIDLVEVADAIEDDLVPSLREYRNLDDTVQNALS